MSIEEGIKRGEIYIISAGRRVGFTRLAQVMAENAKKIAAHESAEELRCEVEKLERRMEPDYLPPFLPRLQHTHPNSPKKRGGR